MLYEFRCPSCDELTEHRLPIEHEPPKCKKCAVELQKQISVPHFILNGSGWYRDGYSSGK